MSELIIAPPSAGSPRSDLRDHFIRVRNHMSSLEYGDRATACQGCLRQGENTLGKEGNPGGRHRYCSPECEGAATAFAALTKAERPAAPEPFRSVKVTAPREPAAERDECRKGHALEGDNVYRDPKGRPVCRECKRDAAERFRAKKVVTA